MSAAAVRIDFPSPKGFTGTGDIANLGRGPRGSAEAVAEPLSLLVDIARRGIVSVWSGQIREPSHSPWTDKYLLGSGGGFATTVTLSL
jgi:hypothetical protein